MYHKLAEIITEVESLLDDAAATTDAEEANTIASMLEDLRHAAATRHIAIVSRNCGNINAAMEREADSETAISTARHTVEPLKYGSDDAS